VAISDQKHRVMVILGQNYRTFRNQIRDRMFLIVEFPLIHLRYKNGLSSMRKHEQIIEHTCLRLMFSDDNSRISKAFSKKLNIVPTAHLGFIKMTKNALDNHR